LCNRHESQLGDWQKSWLLGDWHLVTAKSLGDWQKFQLNDCWKHLVTYLYRCLLWCICITNIVQITYASLVMNQRANNPAIPAAVSAGIRFQTARCVQDMPCPFPAKHKTRFSLRCVHSIYISVCSSNCLSSCLLTLTLSIWSWEVIVS
jgi:hypothetical protein